MLNVIHLLCIFLLRFMINITPCSLVFLLRLSFLMLANLAGLVGEKSIFCHGTERYFWARKSSAACEMSENHGKCYIPQQ